jgi:hypothetical protein
MAEMWLLAADCAIITANARALQMPRRRLDHRLFGIERRICAMALIR